jgi:hypothetical protein
LALASAISVLSGCEMPWSGDSAANEPEVRSSELTDADGPPCPEQLPTGDDPSGHGFGTEAIAEQRPSLLRPQRAWVCQYNPFNNDTTSNGGAVYSWRLAGSPASIAAADIPDLREALAEIAPADRRGGCTHDLGARWMVVYSHDGDLTGILVDDYGCQDVRLTDNPHTTPPGADNQDGAVGGVLDGGQKILDALGVGRSN